MTQALLPLGTKVCVPALPPPFLRRPRLERVLADGARRAITLVSAAPGSGKTTLLAGWFRDREPGGGAWLSLDHRDNDPERLTGAVLGALARAGIVSEADDRLPFDVTALDRAFDAAAGPDRRVLVLDDVQELTSPGALAVLTHLVERTPANLDVVIATRADPPLGLARLRLAGHIGEVRGAHLAFTLEEASTLFRADGLSVTSDEVRHLWERTEGWAAGLRLAACSLERGADPELLLAGVGAEGAEITDYLVHEVLLRQDPQVQELLLRTSVVDRLTPELATVLSGDPDAGRRLSELEHRGVFLARLDGTDWFRYHPLLARLLRGRLRRRDPVLTTELHRRAAAWYASCGMVFEAEDLARAGGDWDLLGAFLGRRWLDAVLDGDEAPRRLTSGIPAEAIATTPMLSLLVAAEATVAHDAIGAEHHRRAAGSGPAGAGTETPTSGPIHVATAVVDVLHGCAFGADSRSAAGARFLGRSTGVDARADYFLALRRACSRLDVGDVGGAQHELQPLVDGPAPRGIALEGEAMLSLLHAVTGRLSAASRRAEEVLSTAQGPARARLIAGLASTLVASQRGEAHGLGHPHDGSLLESRPLRAAQQAVGRWLAGGTPIVGLDDATARHPFAGRALVALGVVEVVDSEHHVVTLGGPAEAAVGRARGALAAGAHQAVLDAVEPLLRSDPSGALTRTVIEAHVLAAVAHQARGQYTAANEMVRVALIAAAPEGTLAPLISHGAALGSTLQHLSSEIAPHQQLSIRLIDTVRQMQPMPFADPLTDRERVVLCFLPTMMTNAEIAASMHLSVNTIKTHLKALYRKLNVERRRDAVVRARQLDLL